MWLSNTFLFPLISWPVSDPSSSFSGGPTRRRRNISKTRVFSSITASLFNDVYQENRWWWWWFPCYGYDLLSFVMALPRINKAISSSFYPSFSWKASQSKPDWWPGLMYQTWNTLQSSGGARVIIPHVSIASASHPEPKYVQEQIRAWSISERAIYPSIHPSIYFFGTVLPKKETEYYVRTGTTMNAIKQNDAPTHAHIGIGPQMMFGAANWSPISHANQRIIPPDASDEIVCYNPSRLRHLLIWDLNPIDGTGLPIKRVAWIETHFL